MTDHTELDAAGGPTPRAILAERSRCGRGAVRNRQGGPSAIVSPSHVTEYS
ncbi:MAG: hypothetical protein AAF726_10235 [Planctomycetota bacterium]